MIRKIRRCSTVNKSVRTSGEASVGYPVGYLIRSRSRPGRGPDRVPLLVVGGRRRQGSAVQLVRARDARGVRVVDSVFAFRPEWDRLWDVRIWLDVEPEASTARFLTRTRIALDGAKSAPGPEVRSTQSRKPEASRLWSAERGFRGGARTCARHPGRPGRRRRAGRP